jgi:hypothetical protein
MKWLAMAVASVALLGCRADQEQQGAKCELEARKTYPNVENMYLSAPAGRFIELCMKAAGYDFNYDNPNCASPNYVVSEKPNVYCYVPQSEWSRMGQKLESWLTNR